MVQKQCHKGQQWEWIGHPFALWNQWWPRRQQGENIHNFNKSKAAITFFLMQSKEMSHRSYKVRLMAIVWRVREAAQSKLKHSSELARRSSTTMNLCRWISRIIIWFQPWVNGSSQWVCSIKRARRTSNKCQSMILCSDTLVLIRWMVSTPQFKEHQGPCSNKQLSIPQAWVVEAQLKKYRVYRRIHLNLSKVLAEIVPLSREQYNSSSHNDQMLWLVASAAPIPHKLLGHQTWSEMHSIKGNQQGPNNKIPPQPSKLWPEEDHPNWPPWITLSRPIKPRQQWLRQTLILLLIERALYKLWKPPWELVEALPLLNPCCKMSHNLFEKRGRPTKAIRPCLKSVQGSQPRRLRKPKLNLKSVKSCQLQQMKIKKAHSKLQWQKTALEESWSHRHHQPKNQRNLKQQTN